MNVSVRRIACVSVIEKGSTWARHTSTIIGAHASRLSVATKAVLATASALLTFVTLPTPRVDAATLYWDAKPGPGIGTDGDWVTSNDWNTDAGGANSSRTNWTNGSDAYFGGVAGTVNLNSAVTVNSLTFAVTGYVLSGSNAITLGTSNAAIDTGSFNVSISATLAGTTGGFIKSGTGALTLSGSNTYGGGTSLAGGLLALASSGALGSVGTISFNGGTLQFSASNTMDYSSRFSSAANQAFNLDTNGQSVTFASALASSGGALTKSGSGTLTLSGANTFSGKTQIQNGTLSVTTLNRISGGAANSSLGAPTTVANGTIDLGSGTDTGTLAITGSTSQSTDRVINLAGTTGGGTLDASGTGSLQFTSDLTATNAGAKTFTLQGTSTTTNLFTGAIVNGSGTTSLAKAGTGTWTLDGSTSNTFTGATAVSGGTLILAKTGGAIAISSNVTIGDGSGTDTLRLAANNQLPSSAAVTFNNSGGTPTLDLNGFGQTLGSISSTNTGALISLGSPASAITLAVGDAASTTFAGTISGGANAAFTKQGAGTLTLSGSASNTNTGMTTVAGGTLLLSKSGGATALGSSTIVIGDGTGTDTLQFGAANQLSSGVAISFNNSGGTPAFNLNAFSQTVASISSTNTNAAIQLGSPASPTTFTFGDSSNTIFAGSFSGGSNAAIVKQGSGTVTLSGNSSNTGAVTIAAGAVTMQHNNALGTGTAGTTVSSGATLQLQGGLSSAGNGTLTLAGTGGGSGGLIGLSGDNRWANNLALSANTTIANFSSGYLALGNTSTVYNRTLSPLGPPTDAHTLSLGANSLTLSGSGTIYANARITGAGNLTVDMSNTASETWLTANMNTFTGTTTVKNGTLVLATTTNTYPNDPANPNFFGINGPLVIGDGSGSAGSAIVNIQAGTLYNEMMNFTTPVTLKSDGKFLLQSAQSINTLTFTGGQIDLSSTGNLYLNGDVTVNASSGNTATISGSGTSSLSLTIHQGPVPGANANRIFNIVGGAGNTSDLTISSVINNGSITKTGAGTMMITSNNMFGYEGTTTIDNGILNIQHGKALGQADGTDNTATVVNGNGTTNGTLQLQGDITVANEKLTLNSSGYGNNGALQNVSGNNTWTGSVVLGSDSRVQSDSGQLTLSGPLSSTANASLDVRGSGNTTISGPITTGTGGVTKNGGGTLTLSGSNTYSGATTISQGVVSLQHNNGLGASSSGTTVAGSGAALELSNVANGNLTTAAEPLFLNGTGISGNGALRNAAGNNTFSGLVTLNSASLITANSGTSLTLGGGVNATNQALAIGTTSNNGNVTLSGNTAIGSGTLTKAGSGTFTFNGTTGTVGQVNLNAGTIVVGSGGSSTLNTQEFASAFSTTLTIASGGTVTSVFDNGITNFNGVLGSASAGTFTVTSAAGSASGLQFGTSFTASNLTLNIGGTTKGSTNLSDYFRLELSGVGITVGTIHITGDTILDFNNSAGTFLSSGNVIVDAGVKVSVEGWISVAGTPGASTIWAVTNTSGVQGSSGNLTVAGGSISGVAPLTQITFNNYNGLTTTWVSGTGNGWFNREIRPTPEPATYGALFVSGCLGLLGWRRWSRRKDAASRNG